MPKFLDVPYYYGSRGEELSLDLGEQIIQLEDGENTFNVWNFDTGRYRLKAPESISSTLTVNFTVSQYAGTISFTPTMIDVVEAISFEIYPTSWMTMDSVGYFQILFKNTKLSETNGSSNIFSWASCPLIILKGNEGGFDQRNRVEASGPGEQR